MKKTGVVRVINYPKVKTCPKGQKLISWNQTGPQGVQGLQGLQGPPGPSGITKIHITHVTTDPPITVGAYDFQFGTVDCPAGKVIGGGFSAPAGLGQIGVVPYQSFAADADTWWVAVRNPTGEASPFWVWAVCMTTEPGSVVANVSPAAKKAIKIAKARRG